MVGTGYGRYKVTFGHTQVTEISCHARGAVHMFPGTRTVIDMGGQDTKAIRVGADRRGARLLHERQMRRRHRAVPGVGGRRSDIPLGRAGAAGAGATKPVKISTTCTVFAESEILSWLARGKKIEDILRGVHQSIAAPVVSLLRRVGIEPRGHLYRWRGAQFGMVKLLEEMLECQAQRQRRLTFHGRSGRGPLRPRPHPQPPGATLRAVSGRIRRPCGQEAI